MPSHNSNEMKPKKKGRPRKDSIPANSEGVTINNSEKVTDESVKNNTKLNSAAPITNSHLVVENNETQEEKLQSRYGRVRKNRSLGPDMQVTPLVKQKITKAQSTTDGTLTKEDISKEAQAKKSLVYPQISKNKVEKIMKDLTLSITDELALGDLIWARIPGHPWWPCIITEEPGKGVFSKLKTRKNSKVAGMIYHVHYFGKGTQRGWTVPNGIMMFKGKDHFDEFVKTLLEKSNPDQKEVVNFVFRIPQSRLTTWKGSVMDAEEAILLSKEERKKKLPFLNGPASVVKSAVSTPNSTPEKDTFHWVEPLRKLPNVDKLLENGENQVIPRIDSGKKQRSANVDSPEVDDSKTKLEKSQENHQNMSKYRCKTYFENYFQAHMDELISAKPKLSEEDVRGLLTSKWEKLSDDEKMKYKKKIDKTSKIINEKMNLPDSVLPEKENVSTRTKVKENEKQKQKTSKKLNLKGNIGSIPSNKGTPVEKSTKKKDDVLEKKSSQKSNLNGKTKKEDMEKNVAVKVDEVTPVTKKENVAPRDFLNLLSPSKNGESPRKVAVFIVDSDSDSDSGLDELEDEESQKSKFEHCDIKVPEKRSPAAIDVKATHKDDNENVRKKRDFSIYSKNENKAMKDEVLNDKMKKEKSKKKVAKPLTNKKGAAINTTEKEDLVLSNEANGKTESSKDDDSSSDLSLNLNETTDGSSQSVASPESAVISPTSVAVQDEHNSDEIIESVGLKKISVGKTEDDGAAESGNRRGKSGRIGTRRYIKSRMDEVDNKRKAEEPLDEEKYPVDNKMDVEEGQPLKKIKLNDNTITKGFTKPRGRLTRAKIEEGKNNIVAKKATAGYFDHSESSVESTESARSSSKVAASDIKTKKSKLQTVKDSKQDKSLKQNKSEKLNAKETLKNENSKQKNLESTIEMELSENEVDLNTSDLNSDMEVDPNSYDIEKQTASDLQINVSEGDTLPNSNINSELIRAMNIKTEAFPPNMVKNTKSDVKDVTSQKKGRKKNENSELEKATSSSGIFEENISKDPTVSEPQKSVLKNTNLSNSKKRKSQSKIKTDTELFNKYLHAKVLAIMGDNPSLSYGEAKEILTNKWAKMTDEEKLSVSQSGKENGKSTNHKKAKNTKGSDGMETDDEEIHTETTENETGVIISRHERLCQICEVSGDVITCKGPCQQNFHLGCLNSKPDNIDAFQCDECTTNCHTCFTCKSNKGDVRKCTIPNCGKFYHDACLKQSPLSTVMENRIICPLHVCLSCYNDSPKFARSHKGRLVRCIRCPTAFHSAESCIAAGSIHLTQSHILCTHHFSPKKGNKYHSHINVNWCFICSAGGELICCESCPGAFHADCLEIVPPEGSFYCPDCKQRKHPTSGNIVWVKLGCYRWWPAEVCHPNNVPVNIQKIEHSVGEFPVRFFGTHDYFWIHKGRVFLFHEGDKGSNDRTSNRYLAKVFHRAVEEAVVAFKNWQRTKKAREINHNSSKPPSYKHIKSNRPVGKVQVHVADVSTLTRCECDPVLENPCARDMDCLNRILHLECHPGICPAGERCQNQDFIKRNYAPAAPKKVEGRGWGLFSTSKILKGQFVSEYVGELIDEEECQNRLKSMHSDNDTNFYFLTIDKDRIIDAGPKGNLSRFMNHSCQPNCETQKWMVNGDTRVGLFAVEDIESDTELTFNYNLECRGDEKTKCGCGADNCSGFIGVRPKTLAAISAEKKFKDNLAKKKKRKLVPTRKHDDECYRCGEGGELLMCDRKGCTKSYHLFCLGLDKPPHGRWECPWHHCDACGKYSVVLCQECPNSFCNIHATPDNIVTGEKVLCTEHTISDNVEDDINSDSPVQSETENSAS